MTDTTTDLCEHVQAVLSAPCCGSLRALMRSHGIDAEAITSASPSSRPAFGDDPPTPLLELVDTIPDDYFGVCPECGKTDGFINVGRGHWFYCREHKTKWLFGENQFDSWRDETEDEQRARYDELGFGDFRRVEISGPVENLHDGCQCRACMDAPPVVVEDHPCNPDFVTVPTCDLAEVLRFARRALTKEGVEPIRGEQRAFDDLEQTVDRAQHAFETPPAREDLVLRLHEAAAQLDVDDLLLGGQDLRSITSALSTIERSLDQPF